MLAWALRCCTLVLLAAAAACRPPANAPARDAGPADGAWSEPRTLADARGRPLALWAPSVATWGDDLLLVGNVVNLAGMVGRGSLGGHGIGIERRPRVLDSLFGLYPHVAVAPRTGIRHLLWAEPEASDSVRWLTPARSLWHATISATGEWSEPARVLEGYQVHWAPATSSPPVFGTDGTLHAAVAVWTGTRGNNVYHLALEESGWRITPVLDGSRIFAGTYTAVGVADNGDLAIAWVAQAPQPGAPPNAAQVAFSTDQGRTWSAAVRLDTATHEESGQPRLVGMRDSFVALWGRYGAATFTLESIERAMIGAGTRTASPLPPIDPAHAIYGPEVVRDACGTVHLAVRHVAGSRSHADYTALSYGADTLQHVDPGVPVSEFGITAARGTLTLGWVGRTASGTFASQVRTRPMLCGR